MSNLGTLGLSKIEKVVDDGKYTIRCTIPFPFGDLTVGYEYKSEEELEKRYEEFLADFDNSVAKPLLEEYDEPEKLFQLFTDFDPSEIEIKEETDETIVIQRKN